MRSRKTLNLPTERTLKSAKIEDLRQWLHILVRELNKGYETLWQDVAVFQVDEAGWIYFGNKSSDGTIRIGRSGTDWNVERRESGTYVAKFGVAP